MGFLADFLQLHSTGLNLHDVVGLTITITLLWILSRGYRKRLKVLSEEIEMISQALIRDGRPVDIMADVAEVLHSRDSYFKRLQDQQDAFLVLLRQFTEEPWRFCDQYSRCPFIQKNSELLRDIKEITNEMRDGDARQRR